MHSMIIGFGSMGKQHYESLIDIIKKEEVWIFSRRKLDFQNNINDLKKIDINKFKYFIIANEASLHIEWIQKLQTTNAKILVEKPLSSQSFIPNTIKNKENIYIGYYLRLHPLVKKIKELNVKDIVDIKFVNNSWLPEWRKNQNYEKSVSSRKSLGGGVLNELSHDLDLAKYIFGDYKIKKSSLKKTKDLNIDVFDTFFGYAENLKSGYTIKFELSMANKNVEKYILIKTENDLIKLDFINNTYKSRNIEQYTDFHESSKNTLLKEQHQTILNTEENFLSKFDDGLWLVNLIQEIKNG